MSIIISDCPKIQLVLDKLVSLILQNNGRLNPNIQIISSEGELSIKSKLNRKDLAEIIYVPDACLPSIEDFNLVLDGDTIVAKTHIKHNASNLQVEIFLLMIDLFNLTKKIKFHCKTWPVLALKNAPNIINHLQKGSRYELKNLSLSDDIISSFIRTRWFKYSTESNERMILLPLIDCINHHHNGQAFITGAAESGNKGVSVINSKPVASSDECFVRYNASNDALDHYIIYGFVDIFASMPLSVPHFIDLGIIGKLKINRIFKQKLPLNRNVKENDLPYPKDLHNYFPEILENKNKLLEVSGLIIPPKEAVFSLRRILQILIKMLSPSIADTDLLKCTLHCETTILRMNHRYYDELQVLLHDSPPESKLSAESITSLSLLVTHQKEHFFEYQKSFSG